MVALILAIMVAVATAAGGGVVAASDAAAPGDLLYGVDRGVEQVRRGMARGEREVEFLGKVAGERLDEIEAVYDGGDDASFAIALDNYDAAVQDMLASAQGGGADPEQAELQIDARLDEQAARLDAILDAPKDGELPDGDSGEEAAATDYCVGTEEHPTGMRLAALYGVPYDEIMGYFCDGYGFGEIRLAYELSAASDVAVTDVFAMAGDGRGWAEIAATLGVSLAAFADYDFDGAEAIDEDERADICTSEDVHPTAARLADLYGVTYDEVLGWFCAGYDFDEIRMAYDISRMSGRPVADVFTLYDQHATWEPVLVALGLLPEDLDDYDDFDGDLREAICTGEATSATLQAIAGDYGVSYEDVRSWYCDGYSFSAVRLAYELARLSGEPVATVFDLYEDEGTWGEVLAALDLTLDDLSESFRDDIADLDDDDDDADDDDDDEDDEDDDEDGCTGANPHPVAQRLDEMYDTATYDEIVAWHCEGFGFGEIMHALATGQTVDMAPEELLRMKTEMGGWGQVWKDLNLIGPDREPGERHAPPNGNNGRGNDDKDKDKDKENNGRGGENSNRGNNGSNGRGNGNGKGKDK